MDCGDEIPLMMKITVRNYLQTIIDGPQCLRGIISVWYAL